MTIDIDQTREDFIKEIQKICSTLLITDKKDLLKKEEGVSYSLSNAERALNNIFIYLNKIQNLNFDKWPNKNILYLLEQLKNIDRHFNSMKAYNSKAPNSIVVRNNLVTATDDFYGAIYEAVNRNMTDEIDSTKFLESAESTLKTITDAEIKAKDVLSRITVMAEKEGVDRFSKLFKDQADIDEKNAGKWIWIMSGLGFLIVALAVIFFMIKEINIIYHLITKTENLDIMSKENLSFTIQLVVGKLIIFSILFYSIAWANKNYKAQKNSAFVNRQRANALITFESFIDAAKDNDTKNAVLLKTTEAIFSIQSSGFLSGEADQSSNTQIFEIFRGMLDSKNSGG